MYDWFRVEVLANVSRRHVFIAGFIAIILVVAICVQVPDNKLHVIFCDVGQGDSVLIVRGNSQILVDGGPDNKVLACLGRHIPFWDRTIEMAVITHPQADHASGMQYVLDRYSVKYFVTGAEKGSGDFYGKISLKLAEKEQKEGTNLLNLYSGDKFAVNEIRGEVVWPSKDWAEGRLSLADNGNRAVSSQTLSGQGKMWQSGSSTDNMDRPVKFNSGAMLGVATTEDLNDFSEVISIKYGDFAVLLTGDADSNIDDQLLKTGKISHVDILKYPHHGSRTGATREFLEAISPTFVAISVGRGNTYGHPAPETLAMLKSIGIDYRRTDLSGDIEITSDGKRWWVK